MSLYSRLELGITIIQYSHLFYHKYSSMTQAKRVHMRILLKLKAKLSGKYNYRAKDHKSTTGHFYTAKLLSNLSTSTGLTFNM